MTSTIPKNQIIYRYGLDIFHNLSDFKTLVSDIKNIADNVGMDWKICFGLCPINELLDNQDSLSGWAWTNLLQDGWQYSKEIGDNVHFLNMPASDEIERTDDELPSFYCYNIDNNNIDNCNNDNTLTNWLSFKQTLLNNLWDINGNGTEFSYPFFGKYNNGDGNNPDWEYYFYAQRCSIIFYLDQLNANSVYVIDCFCVYQYITAKSVKYPLSKYVVGRYGVTPNNHASLKQWLTNPTVNGEAYSSSSAGSRYEVKSWQNKDAEQFTPCYLKYTYFCGEKTVALSSPFFTQECISITPQNRNSSTVKSNTISIFFSQLCEANNSNGFCVLESNGETNGMEHYIHCYTNSPWCIPYTINDQRSGWFTIAIPSGNAREKYLYNGLSQFKDVTGRYTPHLYKKFWGGRELYDCFILEDANGNTKKMFGGSFFCIDFADEEEGEA